MTTNYHQQKSFKLNCYSSIFYLSYRNLTKIILILINIRNDIKKCLSIFILSVNFFTVNWSNMV
jgi:hypothetical protein